jgi:hypothetical protein
MTVLIVLPIRSLLVITVCSVGLTSCASSTTDPQDTPDTTTTTVEVSPSMRGLRYCEVLLLNIGEAGLEAEVYNTYPLNDCPDNVWRGLDGGAIAQSESVPFALLNGPRFWLMDTVERLDDGSIITKTFSGSVGDIEMNRYAVVKIGTPDSIGQAYVPQNVDRKSRFTFRAGSTIFVLTDPSGARYVMQSWSQQRDPNLVEAGLQDLGSRLALPEGWTFAFESLEDDLVLDSTGAPAQVFQDDLMNTYSLITG